MNLRSSSQQPPGISVRCDPVVNRTRHVGFVTCAVPLGKDLDLHCHKEQEDALKFEKLEKNSTQNIKNHRNSAQFGNICIHARNIKFLFT